MDQPSNNESWQVDVGGQVYTATFAELGEWIGDGALQPEDKVRKGNLRWIEARKVPGLIPFFNAKTSGEPIPVVVASVDVRDHEVPAAQEELPAAISLADPVTELQNETFVPTSRAETTSDPNFCAIHNDVESAFLCETCANGFCKGCPRSYGGTVKICPLCGAMCKAVAAVREERRLQATLSNAINEGFGMTDFIKAVAHPFKFKASLFFGAVMFAFFSVTQSATGLGGMVMFASAILCFMLANMMLFGVLSNTVEQFSQGNLESNFMPSFDDFSMWDDVVQPFFLYIAVMITSFGPFIVTLLIGTYLVVSSASSQMDAFQSEVERLPGTQYYQGRETVKQSSDVKRVIGDLANRHEETIGEYNEAATGNSNVAITQATPDGAEELWNEAQQARRKELEGVLGKSQETQDREFSEFTSSILKLAAPLVVIGALAFLWGLFFFPAAVSVAAYTRSFSATINPLVGLDTIKRLGADYAKILAMGFVLIIASGVIGVVIAFVFSPFNLPGVGNIAAKGFSSLVTFYLVAVFACILGYALFKNSDKLQLLK
jgi:hypothetical protein